MLTFVSSLISTLLIESDKVTPGQEKYNLATFMVLFLLITIEVVVVKVVTDVEEDEISYSGLSAAMKGSKIKKTKRAITDDGRCVCCLAPFLTDQCTGVRCNICSATSCRKSCSRWNTMDNTWHCIFCHQERLWVKRNEKWFENFGDAMNEAEELHSFFGTAKSRVHVAGHIAAISNIEQHQETQKEKRIIYAIQNFVEKIVESLVDGVDDTPIDQLYRNSACKFLDEYRPPLIIALTGLTTCLEASLIMTKRDSLDSSVDSCFLFPFRAGIKTLKLSFSKISFTSRKPRSRTKISPSFKNLRKLFGSSMTLFKISHHFDLQNKTSTDPALAHAALREIVERAMEEARKLPELDASVDATHLREGRAIADHSYEDLLATAILNKVIDKFQKERVDSNSNVLHDSLAKYTIIESKHNDKEDMANYISHHIECNDDCNKIIKNADHRKSTSFMMEERIEEVTTISSDDDLSDNNDLEFQCTRRVPFPEYGMDIIDDLRKLPSSSSSSSLDSSDLNCNKYSSIKKRCYVTDHTTDLVSPIESWKDNWLFQKRRTSWPQSDAVVMLVPSSNTYYKALIGDRNAEDTSDLSECSSTKSDEEIEQELMEAINNVVPSMLKYNSEENKKIPSIAMQFGKDEIDVCVETDLKIENNVAVSKSFEETDDKKHLEVFGEETIKDDDNEEKTESSLAYITLRKGVNKAKREIKDTVECDQRIITTAMENSVQKDLKIRFKKIKKSNRKEKNALSDEDEEQRDSEYTEHYDTAIQRHVDSLTKIEDCTEENKAFNEMKNIMNEQLRKPNNFQEMIKLPKEPKRAYSKDKAQLSYVMINNKHIDVIAEDDRLSAPPRPGTIAEREHKKWENAAPIENNPYSEESIRKRCLERQYSKNLDIPGAHYELTKLNEVNSKTLLKADQPDIKR
ncbi:hypothetical protein X777_04748 [Ooceraea biroi]|uniref:FYVE-type zinc finger domain-containing protein n=1 Tax=Ooceraea biroi TaxID=2015173 RepID=A0A026WHD1_OOCBI|nr:hypothetical protein X777_04748 [Ooceraea biroi]